MTAATQPALNGLRPRSRPTARNKLALIDAAWVCHHLPALADLNQADKAVLCALIRHIDQLALDAGKTTVWPSTSCLALDTGYTERSVTRSISRLEARHLIKRFLPPRWRTYHTDLDGFSQLAGDALDAHAAVKAERLPQARSGRLAIAVERETVSADPDIVSAPTETDIEPEISVQQSDAARGQFRRRPDRPAAPIGTAPRTPSASASRRAKDCSPGRAGLSACAEPASSVPAQMRRAALVAAWQAFPTFRRLVDVAELQAAPLEQLAAAVERDYLATVMGVRNPHHIWAWAVNRHGLANTVLGWLIACDTPPSADRPERNPGGWFTRFATAERPWNLARNLRQISVATRYALPPAAAAPPTAEPAEQDDEPTALSPEATAAALAAYRSAWIHTLSRRIGSFRAESVWKAWLSQAVVAGVEDDRLQIRVRGRATPAHLYDRFDDVCRIAARAVGYEGVDFSSGTSSR